VLDLIENETGTRPTSLRVDGGATRNRALVQMIADLSGLPISVSTTADGSPQGAAMLGALGTGIVGSIEELKRTIDETDMVPPRMSRAGVDQLRAAWTVAVGQVLAGCPSPATTKRGGAEQKVSDGLPPEPAANRASELALS